MRKPVAGRRSRVRMQNDKWAIPVCAYFMTSLEFEKRDSLSPSSERALHAYAMRFIPARGRRSVDGALHDLFVESLVCLYVDRVVAAAGHARAIDKNHFQ